MRRIVTTLFVALVLTTAVAAPRIYSEEVASSFITTHPDPDVIRWGTQQNHFTWQAGYMMFAMEKLWRLTADSTYLNYVRRYVDQNVDAEGNVPNFTPRALDNFIPGYACLLMYELTGQQRYAKAAETIRQGFDDYPRNRHSIFYHSRSIPQLWVDGVFMGQIFLARYAKTMGHPEDFAEVVKQIQGLIALCGRDDGLLFHGWAEQGKAGWAKDQESHSPEVWSEGLGWGAVLLADVFDYLPADQPGREQLLDYLRRMCQGLKDSQDRQTGLWCQVVDKPTAPGNWNETSGTGMFIYLLQSAINKGYIDADSFQPVVDRAYQGIVSKAVRNSDGGYNLVDCSSIGIKGSYEAYISQPREISTYAAFGSFIIGTGIVEHHFRFRFPDTVFVTDYTGGKVLRLDGGAVAWQHDAPLSNDLQLLPDGHLLFTTGKGALELDQKGDTAFCYQSDCHVFACQRLPNGNTFIGECEKGRLLQVSPKGRIVRSVNILPKGAKAGDMAFMRNARWLPNGHYLVAHYRGEKVVEYDAKGRAVWSVSTPGRAHSVIRLANGNTLVSIADANKNPRIEEYSPEGQLVWQLTNDDLPDRPLRFMSGMQYIEGLGLLLSNWQGHRGEASQPHLLLVDRNKHVLCVLPPTSGVQTISNVVTTVKGE
ncbi:MAG: glycoside hydrolase family 88 protein [Prevotella sp.]|nr:glycoside hydrolase family 88 protein [Prevotella sp.]